MYSSIRHCELCKNIQATLRYLGRKVSKISEICSIPQNSNFAAQISPYCLHIFPKFEVPHHASRRYILQPGSLGDLVNAELKKTAFFGFWPLASTLPLPYLASGVLSLPCEDTAYVCAARCYGILALQSRPRRFISVVTFYQIPGLFSHRDCSIFAQLTQILSLTYKSRDRLSFAISSHAILNWPQLITSFQT
jgi:hypothetical protein